MVKKAKLSKNRSFNSGFKLFMQSDYPSSLTNLII
jgi:hypothetical protein